MVRRGDGLAALECANMDIVWWRRLVKDDSAQYGAR